MHAAVALVIALCVAVPCCAVQCGAVRCSAGAGGWCWLPLDGRLSSPSSPSSDQQARPHTRAEWHWHWRACEGKQVLKKPTLLGSPIGRTSIGNHRHARATLHVVTAHPTHALRAYLLPKAAWLRPRPRTPAPSLHPSLGGPRPFLSALVCSPAPRLLLSTHTRANVTTASVRPSWSVLVNPKPGG